MAELTEAEARLFHLQTTTAIVERQATVVAGRYPGIEKDDVSQEIWLWYYGDGNAAATKYEAEGDAARLTKAMYNRAVKFCQSERRATMGYDWRDDYNYSRPEVARLLPLALDPATIPGLSGGGLHDGPSARSDPAYGGGMLASIIDVRTAYGKLAEDDQEYLKLAVALDSKWETIGAHLGIQPNSAYSKYMRILDRMVTRHLGRVTDDDAVQEALATR